jgi:NAD(P)-dependent dehydrogenase (short-subunit alcohol dehydrogenase family)
MNILITGGSSGLGKALVERLASEQGNSVFFTYNSKREEAEKLEQMYPSAKAIQLNFCDLNAVDEFAKQTIPTLNLDVVVNNAYVGSPNGTYFHKTAIDDFRTSFDNNLLPTILITQACISAFRKKKDGRIINVLTSSLMDLPPIGYSIYSANKAYLSQLTKCWCRENVKFGITVNSVMPDYMQTGFANVDERIIEQMEQEHPLKRLLQPEEVADVVVSLIKTSKQVNGVAIPITASSHINY